MASLELVKDSLEDIDQINAGYREGNVLSDANFEDKLENLL